MHNVGTSLTTCICREVLHNVGLHLLECWDPTYCTAYAEKCCIMQGLLSGLHLLHNVGVLHNAGLCLLHNTDSTPC